MVFYAFSPTMKFCRCDFFPMTSILRFHDRCNCSSLSRMRLLNPKFYDMKSTCSVNRRTMWISAIADGKMTGAERIRKRVDEFRNESITKEKFRELIREDHEPPCRWPWFVGTGVVLYTRRTVLEELCNWYRGAIMLLNFAGTTSSHYVQRALGTSISQDVETTLISFPSLTKSRLLLLLPLLALALILKDRISNESFP